MFDTAPEKLHSVVVVAVDVVIVVAVVIVVVAVEPVCHVVNALLGNSTFVFS